MKDFEGKKMQEKLSLSVIEQKLAKSLETVPWSCTGDGLLHFGGKVMLLNKKTGGALVCDTGERMPYAEESYAVTTTNHGIRPMARSVFIITKGDSKDGSKDDVVHYGQKIRIETNPYIFSKVLSLKSSPVSPAVHSKFSRLQECSLSASSTFDAVWVVWHADPNLRFTTKNEPVPVNEAIIIEHCGTSHYLASDLVDYRNDFGTEYEVSVHSFATMNKSQALALEKTGKLTRDLPTKFQTDENIWSFLASDNPATDYKVVEPGKMTHEDLLRIVRTKLLERGSYGIRGLARVFKGMDQNGNKKLDPDDFRWGLYNYGITVSKDEAKLVVEACDRDKDGSVDYDEFLRFLRGELNEERKKYIQMAYSKLDKNKDGKVTLEDIAGLYDASCHPDVKCGKKTPEQVYKEFMSQWDTQEKDGIVTIDEFMDYYKDVSASIDRDDYFAAMMKSAWKLA